MRSALRATLLVAMTLTAACTSTVESAPPASASASVEPSSAPSAEASAAAYAHVLADAINEELRAELLAMQVEDQAVRTGVAPPGDDRTAEELFAAWDEADARHGLRMVEILDEFGWPGWSLVGEDGATAAWVLIQHQDLDLELQQRGLAMLTAAVAADDASPGDLAYLTDRVLVAQSKPQIYGTQISSNEAGEIVPRTPIADPDRVDELRAEAGLGTLEEYYEELREMLTETPAPSPSG